MEAEALKNHLDQTLSKMLEDGSVQKMLEKQVQSCVQNAIVEATRYSSPFAKGLEAYVRDALPMDFKRIGLEGYQHTILEIIREKINVSTSEAIDKAMAGHLEELLTTAPESLKLSEIVKAWRKYMARDSRGAKCTHEVKEDSGTFYHLILKSEGKGHYGSEKKYDLGIDEDKGTIYALWFPYEGDITKKMFVGRLYDFERMLFHAYMGKTKIIKDIVGTGSEDVEPEDGNDDD